MRTNIYKAILNSVLLLASVTACVNEDMASDDKKVALNISASTTLTRAVDATWETGDMIGISMMKPDGMAVISANSNYITAEGNNNFAPNATDKTIYFPIDGSDVTFKAYYPYSSTLPATMVAPLNVADQSSLPDLDFMTAEDPGAFSKENPNVALTFHHRLAKVLFDLTTEDNSISLEGCSMVAKGLKTTGTYDIAKEKLAVDAESTKDISVSIREGKGTAIFLPREAGAGITFEITTKDGGVYTATLKSDIPFEASKKHTLTIKLMKTEVTVSATIKDWIEGPESHSDVVRVVTGLNDSKGVAEGDKLDIFLKGQTEYAKGPQFTFNANGKWTTTTPIYWDDITADPAYFKGSMVKVLKLNDTQMDDILLSDETTVSPFTGVNLELKHAGTKVIVELKSTNGTFSKAELDGATVTFPEYKYIGSVNEKGEFIIDSATKNILPKDGIAIFPPQTILKDGVIAIVTIAGKEFKAIAKEGDEVFGKGIAKKLILDMSKTEVKISTTIVDWTTEEHKFKDLYVGNVDLEANSGDLLDGDQLYIYTGGAEADAERTQQGNGFAYTTDKWSDISTPLHWENMPSTGKIYASITRPAVSSDASHNQLPDYILATPVTNDGGITNTALNFTMNHSVAKVIVVLKSTTYTTTELAKAVITLPNYMTGATMNKGIFVPGENKGTITIPSLAEAQDDKGNKYVSNYAYLQPQDIAANAVIAKVNLTTTAGVKEFDAKKTDVELKYEAGKATTLTITLEKTNVQISTDIIGWTDNPAVDFNGKFFQIGTSSADGFEAGNVINFYKITSENKIGESKTGTVTADKKISLPTENPWYRDDFVNGDKILAVYPTQTIAAGATSFPFTSNGTNDAANDLLTVVPTIGDDANIKFEFKHALSKVTVNIIKGTEFVDSELTGLSVAMNNFKLSGDITVSTGEASATDNATPSFAPSISTPEEVEIGGIKVTPFASYAALVMPQTIAGNTTIITVTFNRHSYEAKFTEAKSITAGDNHIYNITLKKTGIVITTTVAPWGIGQGGDITIQ